MSSLIRELGISTGMFDKRIIIGILFPILITFYFMDLIIFNVTPGDLNSWFFVILVSLFVSLLVFEFSSRLIWSLTETGTKFDNFLKSHLNEFFYLPIFTKFKFVRNKEPRYKGIEEDKYLRDINDIFIPKLIKHQKREFFDSFTLNENRFNNDLMILKETRFLTIFYLSLGLLIISLTIVLFKQELLTKISPNEIFYSFYFFYIFSLIGFSFLIYINKGLWIIILNSINSPFTETQHEYSKRMALKKIISQPKDLQVNEKNKYDEIYDKLEIKERLRKTEYQRLLLEFFGEHYYHSSPYSTIIEQLSLNIKADDIKNENSFGLKSKIILFTILTLILQALSLILLKIINFHSNESFNLGISSNFLVSCLLSLIFIFLIGIIYYIINRNKNIIIKKYIDDHFTIEEIIKKKPKYTYQKVINTLYSYETPKYNNHLIYFKRAVVLYKKNNIEESIDYCHKSIKEMRNANAYFLLAKCYDYLRQYSSAIEQYENLLLLEPGNSDVLHHKALSLQNTNEIDKLNEALSIFSNLRDSSKKDPEIMKDLGLTYYYLHDLENAKNFANNALNIDEFYVEAINLLGIIYDDLRNYPEAIIQFDKALEIDSEYKNIWNNKAYTSIILENFDSAEACLEKVLKIDNNYEYAYKNLGNLEFARNDYKSALKNFKIAFSLDNKFIEAINGMSKTLIELKEYQEAERSNNIALKINKDDSIALNIKARLLLDGGRQEEALEFIEKCLQKLEGRRDTYEYFWENVALVYYKNNFYEKVSEYIRLAVLIGEKRNTGASEISYKYHFELNSFAEEIKKELNLIDEED